MCACTETDVRESANDCTLARGEGHGSRGETLHPICAAKPVYSSAERSVVSEHVDLMPSEDGQLTETCIGYEYLQIESHWTVLTVIL
jgi:hypothetical protein